MKPDTPHIPTLIGMLILVIGMWGAIFLIEQGTSLFSQANSATQPKNIQLVNITDTSFTFVWTTDAPTTGFITYQEKGLLALPLTAFDVRDPRGQTKPHATHFITVNELKPNLTYQITLVNDKKQLASPFLVTTGKTLEAPTHHIDPAFGTLVDQHNVPPTEALVFVSFPGSQTLSSVVGDDGNWVLPIGAVRSADNNRYFIPHKNDLEHFLFIAPSGQTSIIATIENDAPLPLVRIGETYKFTTSKKSKGPLIAAAQTFSNVTGSIGVAFQVLMPIADSAIPSYKPVFKGIGTVGKKVIITLSGEGTPLVIKTTIDQNGNWLWIPEIPLTPGDYNASITSFDQNGAPITITRSFIVLKSGTQVLGAATPSASLKPSPVPSLVASPSAKASASAVPVTGTWEPTLAVLLMGLGLITFGIISFAKKPA